MKIADGELRQILLYDLKLSAEVVRELVADSRQTKQPLLATVLSAKAAPDKRIAQAYAKRLGVPFTDLEELHITTKMIHRLPYQIAARYKVVCFDETATSVKVAMADPRDEQARKALRDYYGKTIRRSLATSRGLSVIMRQYRKQDTTPLPLSTRDLLATILEQASRNNSHDIHFEPQEDELIIKRRVGKQFKVLAALPAARYRGILSWCKVQIKADAGDRQSAHYGRFSMAINGLLHDVTVSTLPTINGEKMMLQLVPPAESIPSLRDIGYSAKDAAHLQQCIEDGRGLLVIAGGHGAEVATTLTSFAQYAAKQPGAMVTCIEEPIRYHIAGATQVEVTHTSSFAKTVGAVIAQNPSTIVSSNLSNGAAAEQLIDFSLSQHLVISGLYGTSLTSVIHKLIGYPVAPALIAASLRLIVVQHRLSALCKQCRIEFAPSGPLKKVLWEQFNLRDDSRLYRQGPGCNSCDHGVHGTVLAAEWLPMAQELQQLIATKADVQEIKSYLAKHSDYLSRIGKLASQGRISIDEATKQAA